MARLGAHQGHRDAAQVLGLQLGLQHLAVGVLAQLVDEDAGARLLLRIANSPFGRVLQAIRENDFRAEALGFRTVTCRTVSTGLAVR